MGQFASVPPGFIKCCNNCGGQEHWCDTQGMIVWKSEEQNYCSVHTAELVTSLRVPVRLVTIESF